MKGFEIIINDRKINAVVNAGIVLITVEKSDITVIGTDKELGIFMNWGKMDLSVGDKIKIIAADIETNSTPTSIMNLDRKELLFEYYNLKKMLTKEGILK